MSIGRLLCAAACCALSLGYGGGAAAAPDVEAAPEVLCLEGERQVCLSCEEARDIDAALTECAVELRCPPCPEAPSRALWASAGAGVGALLALVLILLLR